MNLEDICDRFKKEKNNIDTMKINYFSNEDYSICDYMITNIPKVDYVTYTGKRIFKKSAINKSLEEFKKINACNYERLLGIVKNVKTVNDYRKYRFGVQFCFAVDSFNEEKKILDPGQVMCYHVPSKFYNIDIISLVHEHCHSLKDTYYLEYQNSLVLGEVIPIFFELLDFEMDFLRTKFLQYRLYWLNEQKNNYMLFSNFFNSTNDQNSIYSLAKSYYGCYLGGFYYALILYSMYKRDPRYILNLVSDVLSNKNTTYDMLKKLNIYCDIKGEIFEDEIANIKRVLTK